MDGLYKLKLEVEKKAAAVSRYNIEHNIPSLEEEEYKKTLEQFVAVGRQILNDDSLTAAQIREKVDEYAVEDAKSLLVGPGEDIYYAIMNGGHVGNKAIERLETVLAMQESAGEAFNTNPMFEDERAFLARFTAEEIQAFKSLQAYVRRLTLQDVPRK